MDILNYFIVTALGLLAGGLLGWLRLKKERAAHEASLRELHANWRLDRDRLSKLEERVIAAGEEAVPSLLQRSPEHVLDDVLLAMKETAVQISALRKQHDDNQLALRKTQAAMAVVRRAGAEREQVLARLARAHKELDTMRVEREELNHKLDDLRVQRHRQDQELGEARRNLDEVRFQLRMANKAILELEAALHSQSGRQVEVVLSATRD